VEAVALEEAPFWIRENISLGVLTAHSDKPSTKTPLFLSSLIYKFVLSVLNKSDTISLYIYKYEALTMKVVLFLNLNLLVLLLYTY
jgi:hypothetical protein